MLRDDVVGEAALEAWQQAVFCHGQASRYRPASELVIDLGADLAELGVVIRRCRSASSLRCLVRVEAQLSGLMCLMFVKLEMLPRGCGRRFRAQSPGPSCLEARSASFHRRPEPAPVSARSELALLRAHDCTIERLLGLMAAERQSWNRAARATDYTESSVTPRLAAFGGRIESMAGKRIWRRLVFSRRRLM